MDGEPIYGYEMGRNRREGGMSRWLVSRWTEYSSSCRTVDG